MAAAKAALKWKSQLEGLAWLAPELRSPELFSNEVDDALPGLEGPRHAEANGGLRAVFHKYGDVFFWRIDYRLSLRDGLPGLLRPNGFVSAFMKCCT